SIGLKDGFLDQPNVIRTLNGMLKAKHNVKNFARLNGESTLRIDNAKVKVIESLDEDG
ncbi:1206_t:CDS:2, partial [Racocetra persica]